MTESAPTWPALLNQLVARHDLSATDTAWAMNEMMSGEATPAQIGGFAIGLRAKGETAAGVPVVKHGNRAASSRCGTADVLEHLGVVIELTPSGVATCVRELGIGFCFAPAFHPALRHVGPTRKQLGIPTTFNVLGPL